MCTALRASFCVILSSTDSLLHLTHRSEVSRVDLSSYAELAVRLVNTAGLGHEGGDLLTSMDANFLNSSALPSITGMAAAGPMSPRPRTAVPSLTTATVLATQV